jgi:hypothetical protein
LVTHATDLDPKEDLNPCAGTAAAAAVMVSTLRVGHERANMLRSTLRALHADIWKLQELCWRRYFGVGGLAGWLVDSATNLVTRRKGDRGLSHSITGTSLGRDLEINGYLVVCHAVVAWGVKRAGREVSAISHSFISVIHSGTISHFDYLDTWVAKVSDYYTTLALQSTLPRSANAENARSPSW